MTAGVLTRVAKTAQVLWRRADKRVARSRLGASARPPHELSRQVLDLGLVEPECQGKGIADPESTIIGAFQIRGGNGVGTARDDTLDTWISFDGVGFGSCGGTSAQRLCVPGEVDWAGKFGIDR